MIRVLITDLKTGMKLAQPIQNESGMVLLGEGTEITPSIIDRLHEMGLTSVLIQGKRMPKKSKEDVLADIDERFKKTENEKYMGSIKISLLEHIDELYKSE